MQTLTQTAYWSLYGPTSPECGCCPLPCWKTGSNQGLDLLLRITGFVRVAPVVDFDAAPGASGVFRLLGG
jgi:hypothetical protein